MLFALKERSQFHLPICMQAGNTRVLLPAPALDHNTRKEKCNNEQTSGKKKLYLERCFFGSESSTSRKKLLCFLSLFFFCRNIPRGTNKLAVTLLSPFFEATAASCKHSLQSPLFVQDAMVVERRLLLALCTKEKKKRKKKKRR